MLLPLLMFHAFVAGPDVSVGEDVVYAAVQVEAAKTKYVVSKGSTSHLYRCHPDGSGTVQLTDSSLDDTDPCLTSDGGQVLFWRRDPNDLVGRVWLCSIHPDGSHFNQIKRMTDPNIGSPLDIIQKRTKLDDEKLPGIRSRAGGVATPINTALMNDGTYVFGYYMEEGSLVGLANSHGKAIRRFNLFTRRNGKKSLTDVYADPQWIENPDGSRAFWFGWRKSHILLQTVQRSIRGGDPTITLFSARNGEVELQISGQFLEDVNASRSYFLTTSWTWGAGLYQDGATPLSTLALHDKTGTHSVQLSKPLVHCYGAIFVPKIGGVR